LTPGFRAGLSRIGGTAQRNTIVRIEGKQQQAQNARPLRLGLTILVKDVGRGYRLGRFLCCLSLLAGGRFVGAPRHCLQQLRGVVEISAPKQSRAFTGQPIGSVSRGGIVSQRDALGRRCATFRAPEHGKIFTRLGPVDAGPWAIDGFCTETER